MNTEVNTQTEYKPLYWNNTGAFQADLDALHSKLIPSSGKAETMHGELLRCISKLYYDVFNNGFCNADVLQYQVQFVLNSKEEFMKGGLTEEAWDEVSLGFSHPPRRSKLYEDQDFVSSLDQAVDAVVQYCKTKESK